MTFEDNLRRRLPETVTEQDASAKELATLWDNVMVRSRRRKSLQRVAAASAISVVVVAVALVGLSHRSPTSLEVGVASRGPEKPTSVASAGTTTVKGAATSTPAGSAQTTHAPEPSATLGSQADPTTTPVPTSLPTPTSGQPDVTSPTSTTSDPPTPDGTGCLNDRLVPYYEPDVPNGPDAPAARLINRFLASQAALDLRSSGTCLLAIGPFFDQQTGDWGALVSVREDTSGLATRIRDLIGLDGSVQVFVSDATR